MQTRSQGNQNLARYLDNIQQLPRELRAQRDQLHTANQEEVVMENTTPEGSNIPQQAAAVEPIARRARNIGAGDSPSIHTQRHGIVPPAIPNNNFEIKSGLITMIQNQKFHGLPSEDPLDHLDEFERLCGLTKINGVSEDAFKLRLFPFSLGDKAHQWEKHLPQGIITTWAECKTAFLGKFFSNSRTAKLRNAISGFVQTSTESFAEAWERYKTYQSQCPHHGFTEESLLSTFYRGVRPKIRMLLDTASNGNFLNNDVDEGRALVENLAQADGQYGEDYDRSIRVSADSEPAGRKELKILHDKLDKLLLVHSKQVHFLEDDQVQEGEREQVEEVCFVQNNGNYRQWNNYKPHPNLSYRSNNVANPQDQVYPPQAQRNTNYIPKQNYNQNFQRSHASPPGFEAPALAPPAPQQQGNPQHQQPEVMNLLQEIIKGQKTSAAEMTQKFAEVHHKIDASHNDLHCKFETLNARLKYLESQHASSSVKTTGQLPGKAIQNPKEYTAQSITLRCGKELPPCSVTLPSTEDSVGQEGEVLAEKRPRWSNSTITTRPHQVEL